MDLKVCVRRGVDLLNAKLPNWRAELNKDRLNIASNLNCVLGQLFYDEDPWTPYSTGCEYLGIGLAGALYGFDGYDYDELNALWQEELSRTDY